MNLPLVLMAGFYAFAGVAHFTNTADFMAMMPPYLPAHRALVLVSGAIEVALAVGLLIPRTRRWAAWGVIALLVAVFPANVHVALNNLPMFGATEGLGAGNWLRLPVQLLLIAWAWRYTRPEAPRAAQS